MSKRTHARPHPRLNAFFKRYCGPSVPWSHKAMGRTHAPPVRNLSFIRQQRNTITNTRTDTNTNTDMITNTDGTQSKHQEYKQHQRMANNHLCMYTEARCQVYPTSSPIIPLSIRGYRDLPGQVNTVVGQYL